MRSMVEGVRHLLGDERQSGIQIAQDFTSNQPKDTISVAEHIIVASGIAVWSFAKIVRVPIDLDHKSRLVNVEIGDVRSDRMLTPNLETKFG